MEALLERMGEAGPWLKRRGSEGATEQRVSSSISTVNEHRQLRADAPPRRIRYERYAGAASAPLAAAYRRREPEKTVLYAIARDHLETFLAEPRRRDGDSFARWRASQESALRDEPDNAPRPRHFRNHGDQTPDLRPHQ